MLCVVVGLPKKRVKIEKRPKTIGGITDDLWKRLEEIAKAEGWGNRNRFLRATLEQLVAEYDEKHPEKTREPS